MSHFKPDFFLYEKREININLNRKKNHEKKEELRCLTDCLRKGSTKGSTIFRLALGQP